MEYLESPPSPSFRNVIRHYWSLEQSAAEAGEMREPVLPDGCPEIVFNLEDRFRKFTGDSDFELQPQTLIAGQMTSRIVIGPSGRVKLFGVRFEPFGAFAIFRMPVAEFTNRIERLDSVLQHGVSAMADRLAEAESFNRRIGIFESEFLRHIDLDLIPESRFRAAARILNSCRERRISAVASELGWSERKLERDFLKYVGLTPKMFARVSRFSAIVRALETTGPGQLLDHAHEFGYYDQSHMINEFRGFAADSPTAFYDRSHRLSELFTTGR